MLGWEFPPYSSGGLGTACQGLTSGLSNLGVDVLFVVPSGDGMDLGKVKLVAANSKLRIARVKSAISPYVSSDQYSKSASYPKKGQPPSLYGRNLFQDVLAYAEAVKELARTEQFDVIHAHEWLTFPAAIQVKKMTGKPLVAHVHATEFDRTGDHPNGFVYNIERYGMSAADLIVTVSNYSKGKITYHYGVPSEKVKVVHNAIDASRKVRNPRLSERDKNLVLFLGRITLQKGPDYFVYAAKKVLEYLPNTRFVVAGTGDMEPFLIDKVAELGIADKVLFTGFLTGDEVERAYRMASLYVMPSVSDPFGIAALEAISNGTPAIVSKQCGVSEVVSHCLKADFWDVNELANKIVSALKYREMRELLQQNGLSEIEKFSWEEPARKCLDIYRSLTGGMS